MDSVTGANPIALGIDFEDITHTPAYRSLDSKGGTDVDIPTVTDKLLELFAKNDARVTFFIVSELAERYPDLIRRIDQEGHEIASHTKSHRSLTKISPSELKREAKESKTDLESIVGHTLRGFRAPTCEIDDTVYGCLVESGYAYSSSVMPSIPIPGFYTTSGDLPQTQVRLDIDSSRLVELPLSVSPGVRLPVSGAWIRILGREYTLKSLRYLSRKSAVCTYSHPWEFQRMNKPLPFRCRFRTGEWLWETYDRILKLDRNFVTCSKLLEELDIEKTVLV